MRGVGERSRDDWVTGVSQKSPCSLNLKGKWGRGSGWANRLHLGGTVGKLCEGKVMGTQDRREQGSGSHGGKAG